MQDANSSDFFSVHSHWLRAIIGFVLAILGAGWKIFQSWISKKILKIEAMEKEIIELKSKVDDLISHESGRNSFTRGLYQISERLARQEEKLAQQEKHIDRLLGKEK